MGITINYCIDELERIKITGLYPYGNTQELHTDDYIDVVIDILHKYQQIQEIVKNTDAMTGSNGYACAFIDIREVVEDGIDD